MPQSNNSGANSGQNANAQGSQNANTQGTQNANAQGGQPNAQGGQPANAQGNRGNQRRLSLSSWFARTGLMAGLGIVGFVVLLFALGQAFGLDLLGAFADALSTEVGRWLAVAFFALLIIGLAERGLRGTFRRV